MDNDSIVRIGKYLVVEKLERPKKQKTEEWMVLNNHGHFLGSVHWYSPWRQYCFEPVEDNNAIFNNQCLLDIAVFLEAETEKRKTHWSTKKGDRNGTR